MAKSSVIGVVGLGNMGSLLAANLVGAGFDVLANDAIGSAERAPAGSTAVESLEDVIRGATTVVLSLPNADASRAVCGAILSVPEDQRRVKTVIDTSTIGVSAAREIAAALSEAGITYFDAPVSGGLAGARARTLMVMFSGPPETSAEFDRVVAGLSDRYRRVGDVVGLAQALKLANNYLSAVALIATSEAVAFGVSAGLDMSTMVAVLNESSGQSSATADKFPKHVVTEKYSAGFTSTLMDKDLKLYVSEVANRGERDVLGTVVASIWNRFASSEPGVDFTRIYPFLLEEPGTSTTR
jgi:3-hydroxyisobutyrate dehydrogenase